MEDLRLDLSPGGDGAGNQTSIEAALAIGDTDTYAATQGTVPIFRQIGGTTTRGGVVHPRILENAELVRVAHLIRNDQCCGGVIW